MSTTDNTLGMGRAEKLWRILDPQGTSPDVLSMLSDMPGDRIAHLISECEGFQEDFSRAIVLKIAQEEAFTRDGRNLAEIASILHLAAIMATVISPVRDKPGITNPDGSVHHEISSLIYYCKETLEKYWNDEAQDFHLNEKNRAYFIRGWMLMTFTRIEGVKEIIVDGELDRHLIWVGSRWDDLKSSAKEIVNSGKFDRVSLNEFADKAFDPSETMLPDGSPNQQWYADNRDRLMGYSEEGHYSIFPDSITEHVLSRYTDTAINVCGVPIRVEEFIYLEGRAESPLDETPHMLFLGELARGIDVDPLSGGKAAFVLRNLDVGSLEYARKSVSSYSLPVRRMIMKVLLDYVDSVPIIRSKGDDQRFISIFTAIAPVFQAFFEAKYSPAKKKSIDELLDADWELELEDNYHDALWDEINGCYEFLLQLEVQREVLNDPDLFTMYVRAMTMPYFIYRNMDSDDHLVIRVDLIHENLQAICDNAALFLEAKSMSPEMIESLRK